MHDSVDETIAEFMEGQPRAQELDEMIAALEIRRDSFSRERNAEEDEPKRKQWEARIRETDEQIKVLREERAITGFVEDSVRFAIQRPRQTDGVSELDEYD
jgi:hypothetical protein